MAPRILIVEDEANLREAVSYNLEREGYEVHTAADGAVGLDNGRRLAPDLVLAGKGQGAGHGGER